MANPGNQNLEAQKQRAASTLYWITFEKILCPPGVEYDLEDHMFQALTLAKSPNPVSRVEVVKKSAQLVGQTTTVMLQNIHGMIYNHYPFGVCHLFPTDGNAQDMSKTKLAQLIDCNPSIKKWIGKVDEVGARQIGKGYYLIKGASEKKKIEGEAGSSSSAKSFTTDKLIFDELDEMSMDMVELFKKRILFSKKGEIVYLSTPTLPDYGITKLYDESDQCVWMIKCGKCGKETCLELEFPNILIETVKGEVFRICKHCKEPLSSQDIRNGRWVAQFPSRTKDMHGEWKSGLMVPRNDMKVIYKNIQSSDPIILKNTYNSDLAMPYQQSDDGLTKSDIYACCKGDPMQLSSARSCAAGVDVNSRELHTVIGYPKTEFTYKVTWIGRLPSFDDLALVNKRHNVKSACICREPDTHKTKEFKNSQPYKIHLIDYQEGMKKDQKIDDETGILTVRRSETLDRMMSIIKNLKIELPRRNPEVDRFAEELTHIVKQLVEDKVTGSRTYQFKKTGPENYAHALAYFILACRDRRILDESHGYAEDSSVDDKNNECDPLAYFRRR